MDVKSASRTLDLYELFARERRPLTVTEISRALNAPLSSCHALTKSLESRGYVYDAGQRKRIYPTRKLFDLTKIIVDAEPWIADLEPDVMALRDNTEETIVLGRLQGTRMITLIVAESAQRVRFSATAGERMALHATSLGKALLSALPKAEQAKLLSRIELEPLTPATIVDPVRLAQELETAAECGYAVTQGEFYAEASAIAAPLKLSGDLCAVCIIGPTARMNQNFDEHLRALGRFVQKAQHGVAWPALKPRD